MILYLNKFYFNILTHKLPWPGVLSVLRVKLPPVHLFTTHDGGLTLTFLLLNVKQISCQYQYFVVFGLTRPGIKPESTVSVADALSIGCLQTQRRSFVKTNSKLFI